MDIYCRSADVACGGEVIALDVICVVSLSQHDCCDSLWCIDWEEGIRMIRPYP